METNTKIELLIVLITIIGFAFGFYSGSKYQKNKLKDYSETHYSPLKNTEKRSDRKFPTS